MTWLTRVSWVSRRTWFTLAIWVSAYCRLTDNLGLVRGLVRSSFWDTHVVARYRFMGYSRNRARWFFPGLLQYCGSLGNHELMCASWLAHTSWVTTIGGLTAIASMGFLGHW
jgi:hypothetical protein